MTNTGCIDGNLSFDRNLDTIVTHSHVLEIDCEFLPRLGNESNTRVKFSHGLVLHDPDIAKHHGIAVILQEK